MQTYKYRFLTRPADSFTCPKENRLAFHPDKEYRKFGIVEYSEPLTIEQATHFDLCPLFMGHFDGRGVIIYEQKYDIILTNNPNSGQLFFTARDKEGEEVTQVWHQFITNLEQGKYKLFGYYEEDEEEDPEDEFYQDQDLGGTGHGDISYSDADPGL